MLIRMKDEYYNGFRKRDGKDKIYLQHDPVLPGCANEEARAELARKFNAKEITAEQYLAARQALPTSRREAPPMCTMALNHGDLAVMHGPDLQKYYEVNHLTPTVVHIGINTYCNCSTRLFRQVDFDLPLLLGT